MSEQIRKLEVELGVPLFIRTQRNVTLTPAGTALLEKDEDVLGLDDFATHHLPLEQAPDAYAMFQAKRDGAVKVVLQP